MPGVPCGDRGNWDRESLRDRSHVCFAKKAYVRLNLELFRPCRSTNSIASKRWLLWNKWALLSRQKKTRILISKTAMVGCYKLWLYANASCDEHAIYCRSAMIEMTCHVNHFLSNDIISLESRPLNFRVFIQAYSLRPQTYLRSLTRVLN